MWWKNSLNSIKTMGRKLTMTYLCGNKKGFSLTLLDILGCPENHIITADYKCACYLSLNVFQQTDIFYCWRIKSYICCIWALTQENLFSGFRQIRLKPVSSATGTSLKIEISPVASLDRKLSNKRITKALIRLGRWAEWSAPLLFAKIVNEYDQEIPQSQTAENPVAPRGRAAQPSRDTRKTN